MASLSFENLGLYQLSEQLADEIWRIVLTWDALSRDTVGNRSCEPLTVWNQHRRRFRARYVPGQPPVRPNRAGFVCTKPAIGSASVSPKPPDEAQTETFKQHVTSSAPKPERLLKSIGPTTNPKPTTPTMTND